METKLIRVSASDDEIFRLEGIRQSMTKGVVVPKSEVLAQYARKLNKKHRHVKWKTPDTFELSTVNLPNSLRGFIQNEPKFETPTGDLALGNLVDIFGIE